MPEEDIFNDDVEVATDVPENATVNEYRSKITIGDVETLDYGETAYVTNTGTPEDPILNFGLPKGASGTLWGQLDGVLSDQADLQAALDAKDTAIATKANANNAALTGTPTAPTAVSSTNNTQIATTAFVQNAISVLNSSLQSYVQSYVQTQINSAVANVLKRMNFSNAVETSCSTTAYTCPSNGYVFLRGPSGNSVSYLAVNGKKIAGTIHNSTYNTASFFPVTSGDKITASGGFYITFVPMR